jgi:hypothetical protein
VRHRLHLTRTSRRSPSVPVEGAPRPPLFGPTPDRAIGRGILGSDHPLVRAAELLRGLSRQWVATAVVLVAAGIGALAGFAWARALLLGTCVVLLVLSWLVMAIRRRLRDSALALIRRGYDHLPVPAIERERDRLRSRRARHALAQTFADVVDDVSCPPKLQMRGSAPLYRRRIVKQAIEEMQAVAGALQSETVSTRGLARAENLITDGASSLYGDDSAALRAELHRINDHLAVHDGSPPIPCEVSKQEP